jgi:nucleoside-diphosphate-sugar epimerase
MQTLAITGASGFLGRHLVSECLLQGRFDLRLLTRDRNKFNYLLGDNITICAGDLLKLDSLKGFLLPDSILVNLTYIDNDLNANIEAVANLIKVAKESGVMRVIHCSTAMVIGPHAKGIVTEETAPMPEGEYQKSKYRIEEMLRFELPEKMELAILRPTEIIGPGGRGLQSMINRIKYDNVLKKFIYHSILKYRQFNYVSVYNVVSALMLLACSSSFLKNEVYFISDDDDEDNNYAAVEKIIESRSHHENKYPFDIGLPKYLIPLLFRLMPGAARVNRSYSYSKISSLGYRKKYTLRSTITEIIQENTKIYGLKYENKLG